MNEATIAAKVPEVHYKFLKRTAEDSIVPVQTHQNTTFL